MLATAAAAADSQAVYQLLARDQNIRPLLQKLTAITPSSGGQPMPRGDGDAALMLGLSARFGISAPADLRSAMQHYRDSADRGCPEGMVRIAEAYDFGMTVLWMRSGLRSFI